MPTFECVKIQFASVYALDQNIFIDESLICLERVPELETVHSLQKE
jgi:hypothetical protein